MRKYFPKRPSGAPLHTFLKLYDVPAGFITPFFEAVYWFICGRRRVAIARYRMICLVLPTDRPKSVRNRCVIEVLGGIFYNVTIRFGFFCGCRGFCNRTESDLFLFLPYQTMFSLTDAQNML